MRRHRLTFAAVALAIVALAAANLAWGSVRIPLDDLWGALWGGGEDTVAAGILWRSRLPQTLTALVAGAALSISGLQMQTLFRNPLAGPSELGVSSGASLGVAVVILLSGTLGGAALSRLGLFGEVAVSVAATAGALAVMAIILAIARRVHGNATLLIIGVMIGYIATAVIGVLKFFSNDEDVRAYVIWGLGSFAKTAGERVYLFAGLLAVLIPLSFLLIKTLNLMLLGDGYARNLGLRVRAARRLVIGSACVLTAVVTAWCGPIVFLGLAVPHLCRSLFGTSDHRVLMPAVTLTGAALALLCNLIARLPGLEGALPINAVTALVGAPIVIRVLLSKRKHSTLD